MAEDKRSFLLYTDLIYTVGKLTDEQAGKLFKHILSYVNDEDPIASDIIIQIAFEPIKQSLKRDLAKYLDKKEKNRLNALKRWEKIYAVACGGIKTDANDADNGSGSGSGSDSDSDIKKEEEIIIFDFRKSLIALGVEKNIVTDWLKVRKTKKAANTETAFKAIESQISLSGITANECIKTAVEHSWSGFKAEWIKNLNQKKKINDYDITAADFGQN